MGAVIIGSGELPVFNGNKTITGTLTLPSGTTAAPSLRFGTDTGTGIFQLSANIISFGISGAEQNRIDSNTFYVFQPFLSIYNSSAALTMGIGSDLILTRDAADTLAQRRGVNGQTFRVYNTYTDASNYERGFARWNTNVFEIGAEKLGTGLGRHVSVIAPLQLQLFNGSGWSTQINCGNTLVAYFQDAYPEFAIMRGYQAFNGQTMRLGCVSELTTIAAAATTDTAILLPAGAIILSVSARVTTAIPTAATFTVGDSASAARYSTAAVSTALNSIDPGTAAGAYYSPVARAVRITPNLTPAANTGRVRITIYYMDFVPPNS